MANSRRHRQREEAPIDREYHGALTVSPALNSEIGSTVAGVLADPDADIQAATQSLVGAIESANRSHICGWAWNPQNPEAPVTLELLDGEGPLLAVVADEERPDLAASGIGDGRYGFKIDLSLLDFPERTRRLEIRFAETGLGLPGSPIDLEDFEATVAASLADLGKQLAETVEALERETAGAPAASALSGDEVEEPQLVDAGVVEAEADEAEEPFRCNIDEISDRQITGWIVAAHRPNEHCVVALREGGRTLGRTIASQFRPDLQDAGIGDGCHTFYLPMPRALLDGEDHLIEVFEEETGWQLTPEAITWRSGVGTSSDAVRASAEGQADLRRNTIIPRPGAIGGAGQTALRELRNPAQVTTTIERGARPQAWPGLSPIPGTAQRTRVLFDISDLVYYIGHHPNLTGIQRVQSSIVLAAVTAQKVPPSHLMFVSFNAKSREWMVIPTGFLVSLLRDLFLAPNQRLVNFSAEEARHGVLPGAMEFDGTGVLDDGNPSVFCLLGAAWVQRDYLHRILAFKRRFGTRFIMTVHDLIPIYARETCDQGTARVFEEFLCRALRHVDHVLCVSENTAKDLKRFLASLSLPVPPITVTRNGSSFDEFLPPATRTPKTVYDDIPQRFVLFVSTIEGRKNHHLILEMWRRMAVEFDDPPYLVCVGRVGWRAEQFLADLVQTNYLNGKIIILQEISDAHLRLLYERCMFTVFPSLYEGWGLPVGESLAAGKVCVCSDRASLPEVAGEFGVYIDIDDVEQTWKVMRDLVSGETDLRRLEGNIRRHYTPITWQEVAASAIAAAETAVDAEWAEPYPYAPIPYSSEISFAWLGRDLDGTFGDDLLARIADARRSHFVPVPLTDLSFIHGEEARAAGIWAEPENWGTWLCYSGGDVVLGLQPNESAVYWVALRLRASGPISDLDIRLSANGEPVWNGTIGPRPRNIHFPVRRRGGGDGWRLRIKVDADLSPDLRTQIAALDSRVPTIGFERLIVVPENDLKTRLDMLYTLLL